MEELDCLGEMCPIPLLKVMRALKTIDPGESIKLITDHSCVVQSISDHFAGKKTAFHVNEAAVGVWEIIFTKI